MYINIILQFKYIMGNNDNIIINEWSELNLKDNLLRGIYAYGFEQPSEIQKKAIEKKILIDLPINDNTDKLILLAFTEKRSKEDIDKLINFLSQCK